MAIRRFISLSILLVMGAVSMASAATFGERMEMAQQRIEHGRRSGALTREEAYTLREDLNRVQHHAARARADGFLDHRERERMSMELERLERRISHLKHNESYRPPGHHRPRY